MKTQNRAGAMLAATVLAAGAFGALSGCGTTNGPGSYGTSTTSGSPTTYYGDTRTQGVYPGYGVIASMDLVQQGNSGGGAGGIGIGTIAGAVAGGLLGSQIGGGTGKLAATAAGVAGGAYAGHTYDNRAQEPTADVYRYNIRMQDGSYQSVTQDASAGLRMGDRVRIDNGFVQRY
jgi:outer membrane lipoprotein SlyB